MANGVRDCSICGGLIISLDDIITPDHELAECVINLRNRVNFLYGVVESLETRLTDLELKDL